MSTRQATPGSSAAVALAAQISLNTRKRTSTELEEEADDEQHTQRHTAVKKSKSDKESRNSNGNNSSGRDKKNRRKKKQRKGSITVVNSRHMSSSRKTSVTVRPLSTQDSVAITSAGEPSGATREIDLKTEDVDVEVDEHRKSPAHKGKGKAEGDSDHLANETSDSTKAEIERLKQELQTQTSLVQKHQAHLTQVQQSLTCQICLDLLHKPFTLAPCGHVACYTCLVQWFTTTTDDGPLHALQERMGIPPNERRRRSYLNKKKTCPICRAHIMKRPAELWSVKSMVGNLVRSGLVDLPVPLSETETAPSSAPARVGTASSATDPWHNIFHNDGSHFNFHHHPPPRDGEDGGLEEMGMYDAEDGGIYRCIDCMHEIYGGVCTFCDREYHGHRALEDEDEDEEGVEYASFTTEEHDRGDLDDPLDGAALGDLLDMMARDRERGAFVQAAAGLFDFEEEEPTDIDSDAEEIEIGAVHDYWSDRSFAPVWTDVVSDEEVTARIEEVEDEDGYESSFIDDEQDDSGAGRLRRRESDPQPYHCHDVVVYEDEDEDEDEDDVDLAEYQLAHEGLLPHNVMRNLAMIRDDEVAISWGGRPRYRVESDDDEDEGRSSSPEIRVVGQRRNWRS